MNKESFTLVLPTFNESRIIKDSLGEVVSKLNAECPIPWRLIVADNASTDGTDHIVEKFNDPRVSVIHLDEKGRGRAIRAAFNYSKDTIVAFTDADLPVDPKFILEGIKIILNKEAEVVVGTRFSESVGTEGRALLRQTTSQIFRLLAKTIVGLQASDSQCPMKIMNKRGKEIMLATHDSTWWSEIEFMVLCERLGVKMKELPVDWNEDKYPGRKSTMKVFSDGMQAIRTLLRMRESLPETIEGLRKA